MLSDHTPDDLIVGPEVEYPVAQGDSTSFTQPADDSNDFKSEYQREHDTAWAAGGSLVYDGTVGAEISPRSGIPTGRARDWYRETIEYAEDFGYPHEPVGRIHQGGSTAGLHIHLSPISEEQARRLFDMSREPWMKVFVCSSLHEEYSSSRPYYKVFRYNYCSFGDGFGDGNAVRPRASRNGHYEWRVPEPMTVEHFDLVMEFLERFVRDADDAREWAVGLVEDADERITAIKRAREIGLTDEQFESDEEATILRSPNVQTSGFFREVRDDPSTPYIYHVKVADSSYYAFKTTRISPDIRHEINGVTFTADDILDATTLTEDVPRNHADAVEEALSEDVSANDTSQAATSDETHYLRNILD